VSTLVAEAVGQANLVAATLSADDPWAAPWALFDGAGWLSTAAQEAQ